MPLRLEKPVQPSEDLAVDLTVLVESLPPYPYPSTYTSLGTARGELCYSSPYSDRLATRCLGTSSIQQNGYITYYLLPTI